VHGSFNNGTFVIPPNYTSEETEKIRLVVARLVQRLRNPKKYNSEIVSDFFRLEPVLVFFADVESYT
jgi:hypothetical protein